MCVTGKQIMVVRKQADICLKCIRLIIDDWSKKIFRLIFDNQLWILPDFETLTVPDIGIRYQLV